MRLGVNLNEQLSAQDIFHEADLGLGDANGVKYYVDIESNIYNT
jgi:hypothetical protein